MSVKNFFSFEEQQRIEQAIVEAEKLTSGEIRLHIDSRCPSSLEERTVQLFDKLGMQKTALRNGVLFYLSIKDRLFAVIGDKGINDKVPANFWDQIYANIRTEFAKENYCEGLCDAIRKAGEQLQQHFPISADDVNELDNEISFSED